MSNMPDKRAPKCACPAAESEEVDSSKSKSSPQLYCCMKQRYWSMLRDKSFTDVCFVVGIEPRMQNIHAHRNILSVGSSVFKTMFGKNWSQKSNRIEVPDIEPAVFFSLLRYLYIDEIQLTSNSVLKILYAAKKYAVIPLENRCADFLKEQICPDNACSLLVQAKLFDQQKLIESCLDEIDLNTEGSFMSDSFTSIDLALLRSLLQRDTLKICEVDLFDGVLRWSVAECQRKGLAVTSDNQKLVLESAISLIRFPLMTQTEFASKVLQFCLLSNEELIDMFKHFSDVPEKSSIFSSTPRCSRELFVAKRFERYDFGASWSYKKCQNDGIGFSFDHNVRLVGFGLWQTYDDDDDDDDDTSEDEDEGEEEDDETEAKEDSKNENEGEKNAGYKVEITVKNQETGAILCQNFSTHKTDKNEEMYKVLLDKSIKLKANTLYAVITKIQGPRSLRGEDGKKSVCVEDSQHNRKLNVTFKKIGYEGSCKRTNVIHGQIPEILFNW